MSLPPITLTISCYQQETFIAAAVRSALAQDYSPLEILISDDCSRDSTYDIAREEVERYRGPHTIVLNRNSENMGLGHVNRQLELARGDFIIRAHGDDISLPHRARRLVEEWRLRRCTLISSNAIMVDAEDRETGLLSQEAQSRQVPVEEIIGRDWQRTMLGASFAWEREVVSLFGPVDKRVYPVALDHVIPFRAAMLKGFVFLAEPLLRYRVHARNAHHSIADKTGSCLAMEETLAGFNVSSRMRMGDDLTILRQRSGPQEELERVRHLLQLDISKRLRHWLQLRQRLLNSGQRPTWVDKALLEARGNRPEYAMKPNPMPNASTPVRDGPSLPEAS